MPAILIVDLPLPATPNMKKRLHASSLWSTFQMNIPKRETHWFSRWAKPVDRSTLWRWPPGQSQLRVRESWYLDHSTFFYATIPTICFTIIKQECHDIRYKSSLLSQLANVVLSSVSQSRTSEYGHHNQHFWNDWSSCWVGVRVLTSHVGPTVTIMEFHRTCTLANRPL